MLSETGIQDQSLINLGMNLLQKYAVPGPRYTSYPTVPYWDLGHPTDEDWESSLLKSFLKTNNEKGISIYIHLPYCESLCTYCACNKRITKNHRVEEPYINTLLKEWKKYLSIFSHRVLLSHNSRHRHRQSKSAHLAADA